MSIEKLSAVWPEWQIAEQIGEGSFGKVYKAVREEHSMTAYAAIKVISIPQSDAEISSLRSEGLDADASKTYFDGIVNDFVNEIKLMESMKGTSNIVSVEDFRVLEKEDKIGYDIFIRMELLTPFNDYIANHTMSEKDIIKLGVDVCSALELCSRKNIIHRDIKPENIFVSSFGDFKVGDFGIAKELEKTSGAMSSKGTFNYMAPEIAAGKKYDHTVDIYSLGLVLYKLLNNNRLPFIDPYAQQIQYQDRKNAADRRLGGEPLPVPVNASPQLADIVLAACSYDPAQRFSTPTAFKKALLAVSDLGTPAPKSGSGANIKIDLDATTAARLAPAARTNAEYDNSDYDPQQPMRDTKKPKKEKKRMSKGKKVAIIVGIVVFCIFSYAMTGFVNAYDVSESIKTENYSEAYSRYNTSMDDNIVGELILKNLLKGYDDEIVEMFNNGEIGYDSAVEALDALDWMGFKGSAEKISKIVDIKDADDVLEIADEYYENDDYENAIIEYSKIDESNEKYDAAQTKLNELYPKYIDSIVEKAKSYNSAKNYQEAVAYVNTAYDILPEGVDTTELDNVKSEILATYKSDIMDQVTELINASQFEDAFELIDEAIAVDDNEDFRNTKIATETKYVESVTATVDKHLSKEDFISAARTVSSALTVLPDNSSLKALQSKVEKATPTYLLDVCDPYASSGYKEYVNGELIKMGGTSYTNAFSLSEGYALFNIESNYSTLSFTVGHCDGTEMRSTTIKIYCDGILKEEIEMTAEDLPQKVTIDITGVNQLKIESSQYWTNYGFANVTVK